MSFKPTVPDTPRTNRIHVRLTDAEHAELASKATALGITVSDLIRRIAGLPTANVSEARRDAARAKRGVPRTQPASQPAEDREALARGVDALNAQRAAEMEALTEQLLAPEPATVPEPAPFIPPWGRR